MNIFWNRLAAIFALLLPLHAGAAVTGPAKFIPTFLVYYGGGPVLVAADAPRLAKFDLVDIDRFRYDSISPTTWAAVKALNPAIEFYLYEMGAEAPSHLDATGAQWLNGLGRFNNSRGHSMGSLNGNHPELFLLDAQGNRIYSLGYSNVASGQYWHLMDFGASAYQSYWVEAVGSDIATQPWVADGVHADNCLTRSAAGGYSAVSSKYPTDVAWSSAMNTFASGIAAGLHAYGQKLWCNRGETRMAVGAAAWLALDADPTPPDVVADEGAFAVTWGPWAVQFFQESEWKRQLDTFAAISNSRVAVFSHTALAEGQSGTDNWGQPVTYWQTLWYALGSFLLGKNDTLNNAYFNFSGNGGAYNRIWWYPEYELLDLGRALGPYAVTTIGGVNVYWREFEKGYIYVNPTAVAVPSLTLPQASRPLTRDNLAAAPDSIASVSAIALNTHSAAFLLKTVTDADAQAPSVPTGLAGAAVSASQINLSWNASTDDVGVVGYYVYLNNAPLTTTPATSFSHTGLTAGTTYNYRVSAYDAVPNHSAWTATPLAVGTPLPDTQAPSVPAGLAGKAVSASQINLSWNPSTDNVGVVGYYVYLNNAPLAILTATSFSHTGLTAGTTYNYRVSAYDAVPNHSAWTATPLAVSTPAPDTAAPSVPTGLAGAAASTSRINLSWNPSADNVGVVGYYIYLNDAPLATTTATSFSHTGLKAGTTYSYRVSAYDAIPNHSAWTATPLAVKTRRR